MPNRWIDKLLPKPKKQLSYLRNMVAGSLYRISDIRGNSSFSDIKTQIDAMRALARDSQVATALSYYATDATVTNSDGQIIWAVPVDKNKKEVAEVINALFKRWEINSYARDHILELATIGNLYIPTTDLYKEPIGNYNRANIALDTTQFQIQSLTLFLRIRFLLRILYICSRKVEMKDTFFNPMNKQLLM